MTGEGGYLDDKKRATYGELDPSVTHWDDKKIGTGMTEEGGYLDDKKEALALGATFFL